MTTSPSLFSCVLIGDTALPILCGNLLLEHSHKIEAVVSKDPDVVEWAKSHNLHILSVGPDLHHSLSELHFDYLLSIFNVHMLPVSILSLPRKLAINFHDSLLPRNAGLFAPSWAIIQEDSMHGITWHIMEEKPDTGNILQQARISIDPEETAHSLLYKCLQQGVATFEHLITDLTQNHIEGQPQDLTKRTVFTKHQKPSFGCLLSWSWPASKIQALVRGLTFGPSENPMGIGKFRMGDDYLIIDSIDCLTTSSDTQPGTILAADHGLTVSTSTQDIRIEGLLDVRGRPILPSQLLKDQYCSIGTILPDALTNIPEHIHTFHQHSVKHEAYWVRKLSQATSLILDGGQGRDLPESPSKNIPIRLPERFQERVKTLTSDSVSPSLTILAAHTAFLSTLTSQSHFSLGYRYPELHHTLSGFEGLFATTVPLVVDGALDLTFRVWLSTLTSELEKVHKNGSYLKDVWARYPNLRALEQNNGRTDFPIAIECEDTLTGQSLKQAPKGESITIRIGEEPLTCLWTVDPTLFSDSFIDRMKEEFSQFFSFILDNPDSTLSERVPVQANLQPIRPASIIKPRQDEIPSSHSVLGLFEEQVKIRPDAMAIISEDAQVTYAALYSRSTQIAYSLRELGVGPEVKVGILLDRSIDMPAAILATFQAGGTYIPLDPSLPSERLNFILNDAHIQAIISHSSHRNLVNHPSARFLVLDSQDHVWTSDFSQPVVPHPLQAAYMIYTSGTTGNPKGVIIPHGALLNFTKWTQQAYKISPHDRVLQFASWSFDTSLEECFGTLCFGGTLVLRPDGILSSISTFLRFCTERELTALDLPTAFWHILTAELSHNHHVFPSSIRRVIIGGEKAESKILALWREHMGQNVELLNGYGPTETTIVSIFQDLTWLPKQELSQDGLIGKDIDNVQTQIVDKQGGNVSGGLSGELHIGGRGVARGYHNRPALTAQKFTPNPFIEDSGARLYQSGDLVQQLNNGSLIFKRRKDHQVKIRGFRIELGEIESILQSHPLIKEGVVVLQHTHGEEPRLVAYLTTSGPPDHIKEEEMVSLVQKFVADKLPSYMIPESMVVLDALPLNHSGKIDRNRLSQTVQSSLQPYSPTDSQASTTESFVTQIWREVLGKPHAGLDDHFLELGGHSLKVFQLFSRLGSHGYHQLPLTDFFQNPTIRGLSKLIDEGQYQKGTPDGTFNNSLDRPALLPLSFAQEQIWFINELNPGTSPITRPFAFDLPAIFICRLCNIRWERLFDGMNRFEPPSIHKRDILTKPFIHLTSRTFT